jgi:hypothetical protein
MDRSFVPLARLTGEASVRPPERESRRTRRDDVRAIRRRLRLATDGRPDPAEAELAARVQSLKLQLAAATGAVSSCARCASQLPWPRGGYAGGDCCSGAAANVFSDSELAVLAHSGTRPRRLRAASDSPAGCAFRGATGCTLDVVDRPSICVRYACTSLQRELHALGRLDTVEALARALGEALAAFTAARAARLDRQWADAELAAMERALSRS